MIGLATGGLMAAVWQGILLAALVGLGLRLLPRTPPAVRFAIWFAVFLVVAGLPVISLWPRAAGAPHGGQGAWITIDGRWSLAIAAVWLAASLARAASLVAAAWRVRALWKRAVPVVVGDFAEARYYSEGQRRAQVCTSDEVDRPTVIGFFSPKILIPAWLLEKLTATELEQIVLHEAGHLVRADDWLNLLQKIALVIFPLNPALAWVERRLCLERELAVDERVLHAFEGRAGAAKAYATCLATLAEYRLGRRAIALALGVLGRESELGRRVGRILRRGEGMKPLHAKLVLGGAMLGLLVAATGFERCPQVVGFSSRDAQTVAQQTQWQPTRGDETAMNRASAEKTFRAFSVVYKSPEKREIRQVVGVRHETIAVARVANPRQHRSTEHGDMVQRPVAQAADGSARMVQTSAAVSGVGNRSRTISDAAPSEPATGVMQWVVVTTWQDGQTTRAVFTAAQTSSPSGQAAATDTGSAANEQVGLPQQGPRYAAVPVRGGWIVFQL